MYSEGKHETYCKPSIGKVHAKIDGVPDEREVDEVAPSVIKVRNVYLCYR